MKISEFGFDWFYVTINLNKDSKILTFFGRGKLQKVEQLVKRTSVCTLFSSANNLMWEIKLISCHSLIDDFSLKLAFFVDAVSYIFVYNWRSIGASTTQYNVKWFASFIAVEWNLWAKNSCLIIMIQFWSSWSQF